MTNIDPDTIKPGDVVRVDKGSRFWRLASSNIKSMADRDLVVRAVKPRATGGVALGFDEFENHWGFGYEYFTLVGAARPVVDFSGASRLTARGYAADLLSPHLSAEHGAVLADASMGKRVDALRLNEVLTLTLRRTDGTVDQRRDRQNKAGYLAHIVQAVLSNHIDQLPVYIEGQRSRKIVELEEQNRSLRQGVQDACDELRACKAEIVRLGDELVDETTRSNDRLVEVREESDRLDQELDTQIELSRRLAETVQYALGLLAEADSAVPAGMVLGFMDALGIEIEEQS